MSAEHYSAWSGQSGARVIAVGGDGPRTFAELCADAERLAALLPAPAARDGDERSGVLIACSDRYLFAVALLASWTRGHAAALPPSHRPGALAELAAEPGIAATVHDGEAEAGIDLRRVLHDGTAGRPSAAAPPPLAANAHAVTLYTSGSTGAPERVVKRAAQLLGEVEVLSAAFGDGLARVLSTVPPRHIYGLLFGLLLPLRAGAAFARETPLHTDAVLELLRRHEIDALVAVPAHLRALEGVARTALAGLRRVFSSGAPLPDATFDALANGQALRVVEVLGSTETGGIGHRSASGAPYQPFDGVIVREGDDGQLLLRSPRLSPELAQPHACEDRIELLPSGAFRHLGRADDVVKVGGTRVSLPAIEQRARSLPGIRDAAAIARAVPGARGHEILLAAAGEGWDAARMRTALGAWLPPVALPRRYRFVSELPREATGKLRRDALLSLFEPPAAGGIAPALRGGTMSMSGIAPALRGGTMSMSGIAPALRGGTMSMSGIEWGPRVRAGDRVRVELRVPAGFAHFRGHFEGWPVLPGVAQLGLVAVREALSTWPELRALRRARQLKFKRPIEPEQTLALELVREGSARVDFRIERAGELCSSGSLIFAAQDDPS
jgi:4-coumarate--CoA ligase (photoactive yellow protein activation family)